MKREFTIGWLIFGAAVVAAEFIVPPGWRDGARILALGIFAVLEGWAIGRKKPGDTLTEHVGAFYGNRPARLPLVFAAALYFPAVLVQVVRDPDAMAWGVPITAWIWVVGIALWIVPHFYFRGTKG